jgi:hypothetical protein
MEGPVADSSLSCLFLVNPNSWKHVWLLDRGVNCNKSAAVGEDSFHLNQRDEIRDAFHYVVLCEHSTGCLHYFLKPLTCALKGDLRHHVNQ